MLADGRTVIMTALRHPVARIVNRYWFEGRRPQYDRDQPPTSKETGADGGRAAVPFEAWLAAVRANNKRDNPGRKGYVWQCVRASRAHTFAHPLVGCSLR